MPRKSLSGTTMYSYLYYKLSVFRNKLKNTGDPVY